MHGGLYEGAARDAILCVGAGKTLYIGSLGRLDWHSHGVPVLIAGMAGAFRLRCPLGHWHGCRAAIVPAGVRHALELGGEPLAAFYPEPLVADLAGLMRLAGGWDVCGRVLMSDHAELGVFRELYEDPAALAFADAALDALVERAQAGGGPPALDRRLTQVLESLDGAPDDLTPVASLAAAAGLSTSRFVHLFGAQIGVPFRRYRIWNRLRAASRLALAGHSLTDAAHAAGFADSAHFAHLHRATFGVMASATFARVGRAGLLGGARPAPH
jgi:AraC-like DNA-binding protein